MTEINIDKSNFTYYCNGNSYLGSQYKNVGMIGSQPCVVKIPFVVGTDGASSISFSINKIYIYNGTTQDNVYFAPYPSLSTTADVWNVTTQDASLSNAKASYKGEVSYSSATLKGEGSVVLGAGSYYLWIFPNDDNGQGYAFSNNTGATITTVGSSSIVSAPDMTIGRESTISICRYSDAFTHVLNYKIGDYPYMSITGEGEQAGTSCVWEPPKSLLPWLQSDKTTLSCTIQCTTYNGSVQVGEPTTCNIILSANAGDMEPILTISDDTEGAQVLLGTTSVTFTIAAEAKYNATISSYVFTCGSTTETGDVNEATLNKEITIIPTSQYYSCSITDSRGYTKTVKDQLGDYIAYFKPTISVSATPPILSPSTTSDAATSNGKSHVTIAGTYCSDVGNIKNLTYSYKIGSTTKSATLYASDLTISKYAFSKDFDIEDDNLNEGVSCVITCAVTDGKSNVAEASYTVISKPMFYWSSSDFYFNSDVHFLGTASSGTELKDYVVSQEILYSPNGTDLSSSADVSNSTSRTDGIVWHYQKWQSGYAECWGRYYKSSVTLSKTEKEYIYHSDPITLKLPITFQQYDNGEYPVASISGGCSDAYDAWVNRFGNNSTELLKFVVLGLHPLSAAQITVDIIVRGLWRYHI